MSGAVSAYRFALFSLTHFRRSSISPGIVIRFKFGVRLYIIMHNICIKVCLANTFCLLALGIYFFHLSNKSTNLSVNFWAFCLKIRSAVLFIDSGYGIINRRSLLCEVTNMPDNPQKARMAQLRTRLLTEPLDKFSSQDVLQVLLSYCTSPKADVNELAVQLRKQFGTFSQVLDAHPMISTRSTA